MRSAPKVAKVIAPDEALHRTMLSKNHQHYLAKFDARKRQRFMQEFGDRYVGDQPYDLTTVALDRLDRRPFNVDEAKVAELMKQPPAKDGHPIIAPNATKSRHAHLILDGNHRVEAALRRGDKTLKAYVRRDIATALDHRTVRKSVDALIDRVRESAARDRAEGNLVMAAMGELFAYNLANPTLEKAQSRVKAHTSHSKTGEVEEVRETTRTTKGAKKADLVEGLAKQRAKKSAPTVAAPGEAAPKVAAKAKTPGKAIASPASEPVTSEHWIPVDNLRELRDKIGTLNKKAAKMGLAPITLQEHEQALRKTPIQVDYIPPGPGAPGGPVIKHMSVMHRRVTVTGEAPRLGGWDVVGAIEHTGGERNIVHAFGGHKPPKDAAHRAGDCDHCGHIRKRTKTYLLKRGKTIQQVGKTCLKDFTGHPDPERLASGAEWLDGAMRDLGDEFSGGSAGHGYTPIEPYLAHVARSIHHDGWISKQKAEEQIMESTASAAADTMRRGSPTGKPVTDDHRKLAKAAVAWVRDTLAKKKGLSDYESNLVAVVSQDAIKGRHMGIAASAIPVYQREMERQAHAKTVAKIAKNRTSNEFFGKEGERHDLDLTLAEPPHPYTSSYGTSYIHKFIDGEGRSFSWFSPRDEGIKPGQTVRITGTIKSHREFKGIKETSLGRVTLWTPQAIAAAHAKAAKKAAKSAKPLSKALGLGDRKTGPGDLTADLEAAFAVKLDPDGAWQPMTRAEVVALPAPIRPVGPDSRSDYTKKLARLAARRAGLPEPPR